MTFVHEWLAPQPRSQGPLLPVSLSLQGTGMREPREQGCLRLSLPNGPIPLRRCFQLHLYKFVRHVILHDNGSF